MADFSAIPWIKEHTELYQSDPEKAHMWDSSHLGGPGILPTLLLTTIGRKSGEPRKVTIWFALDRVDAVDLNEAQRFYEVVQVGRRQLAREVVHLHLDLADVLDDAAVDVGPLDRVDDVWLH